MTKKEAIEEAYGEYWDKVKDFVGDNGWCYTRKRIGFIDLAQNVELESDKQTPYHFRPKSLQGIEDNNGWIKIESEEDLPKEKGTYWFIAKIRHNKIESAYVNPKNYNSKVNALGSFSHYQPIVKPKKPIY